MIFFAFTLLFFLFSGDTRLGFVCLVLFVSTSATVRRWRNPLAPDNTARVRE